MNMLKSDVRNTKFANSKLADENKALRKITDAIAMTRHAEPDPDTSTCSIGTLKLGSTNSRKGLASLNTTTQTIQAFSTGSTN